MSAERVPYFTEQQYLEMEREADDKSEYLNGQIFATAGGSQVHSTISYNVGSILHPLLRGTLCRGFTSDMRVRVSKTGLYTYPDFSIACGERRFDGNRQDTLLNPTVIFEVLSPSTESYDRGVKFVHYQSLASLVDYVIISQDRPRVDHYHYQDPRHWALTVITGLDGVLTLPSIDCDLPLELIYENVEFPDGADEDGTAAE